MSGLDYEGGDGHKHGCLDALAITLSLRWSSQDVVQRVDIPVLFLHRFDVLSGNSSMPTIDTPGFMCRSVTRVTKFGSQPHRGLCSLVRESVLFPVYISGSVFKLWRFCVRFGLS